jgi:hypothetical protein
MGINFGTLTPSAIKRGASDITAMYYGATQVWPTSTPDPYLKVWVDAGNASSYSGTGTTWADLSGNSNNLTLNGSPAYDATTGSFYFPNSTSVYAANTALTDTNAGTGDCSIEIWERYQGPTSNDVYYFVAEWGQMNDPNYDLGGMIYEYTDAGLSYGLYGRVGGIRLQYLIPAYGDTITYTKSTDFNVWRQVVLTRNGSNGDVKMYVNGSLYKTITGLYTGVINQYDKLYVGSSNINNPAGFGGHIPFYGDIAIYKLWNGKIVSSTEVTDSWDASKARFGY